MHDLLYEKHTFRDLSLEENPVQDPLHWGSMAMFLYHPYIHRDHNS